ncbi:MAG: universal stress protein [Acidovorax sp.]|nr:universal stress protein [Acidovorax sp.]
MYRVMIAVDGSELALDAVRHGVALVRKGLQAQLILAHVQEEASLYELATKDADMIAAASVEAGQHLMASAIALIEAAGLPFETEVGLGEAAPTLVDMAERSGCDLLLIGARGMGSLRSALLGSVSQAVVHLSPVPVTIVKHPEPVEVLDDAEDDE